ncbi:hypothetical protein P3X46_017339 [Hevea brasiliensis]|uniref:Armadillo repeat-containing domain-containing protein n=1 Tax=Hevea brasiliensis TaxID=3981 RepID=A0ABQ9M232_HEVBR|nr:hypothetical protein P3X46_017339 [Hevea brasiliensis]
MAKTLSEIELTDHNKVSLFKDGALEPLLQLLTHDDLKVKKVAIDAIHNLSDVPQNGLQLIREGAVGPLVPLSFKCRNKGKTEKGNAVKLFCCLTQDGDENTLLEHVGQRCIERLLRIITTSNDLEEIAAAMGIISNLPKDPEITLWLLDAGALEIISTCLTHEGRNASYRMQITENAAAALCRFIAPSNLEWQKKVAEIGIIPVLVELLVSGTTLTKQNAAISLKQFSESSTALTNRVKKRWLSWFCLEAPVKCCPVHLGICTVESSFCILEANALEPLVRMLGEADPGACEASLDALLTLMDGERLQCGSKVLAEANAIAPIIKLLSSPSASLQEKTLKALERIFRLVEFKQKYGTSAQMPLVDITQRGSGGMRSLAAKVLAQLNLLTDQSSYF